MRISDWSSYVCSSDLDRRHQLGAVLGDPLRLIFAADHEARDVLEEEQGRPALAGELDEMRALQGTLAEQYAVVRQDRHWHAPDAGEAANQGGAVERLELVELRSVDDAADPLVPIVRREPVVRDDSVKDRQKVV